MIREGGEGEGGKGPTSFVDDVPEWVWVFIFLFLCQGTGQSNLMQSKHPGKGK